MEDDDMAPSCSTMDVGGTNSSRQTPRRQESGGGGGGSHGHREEEEGWSRTELCRQRRIRWSPIIHLLPHPPLLPLFISYLLLSLSILPPPALSAGSSKTNEIEIDWTMGTGGTNSSSNSPGTQSSASSTRPLVQTKFVRLKDVLRFRCAPDIALAIHLVPAESALLCQLPPEPKERDRALIGFCGPKSSDPRLILRRYSPLPGKPSFQEGQSYFFISTSDGTKEGTNQASGGLCRSKGLRLRIVVLPTTGDGAESRPVDEMVDLAQLLFPAEKAIKTTESAPTTAVHHPDRPLANSFGGVFPAILTLKEEGGEHRKVVVNSQQELARQIELASNGRHSAGYNGGGVAGGHGPPPSVGWHQPQPQHWSARQQQDARYELTEEENSKWMPRRRKVLDSNEQQRPAAKSPRSPEPLADSQRLVYIVGYDGHEPGGGGAFAFSSSSNSKITSSSSLLIFCSIFALVPLLWPIYYHSS